MKKLLYIKIVLLSMLLLGCSETKIEDMQTKIIFLHHSTGNNIWNGDDKSLMKKLKKKITKQSPVQRWFSEYNKLNSTGYWIKEQAFPKREPYGWNNYPYDYYNIWVKNAGEKPFKNEPTLEMLTKDYNVIVWKHCYPVTEVVESDSNTSADSQVKTLDNYKLQYNALKEKMHSFKNTKFLVWTGAVHVEARNSEDNAKRAREFFTWVKEEWNEDGDNIYIWDFYELETEGGLFFKPEYSKGINDSHPNEKFADKVYPLFCNRLVDVIENDGKKTNLKGEKLQ